MAIERNLAWNHYTFSPRNKKDEEFLIKLSKYIDELEEENKELKSELDYVRTIKDSAEKTLKELREENKKLKWIEAQLYKENKQLKERVDTLELRLDNKEKLNEEYRKQIDKLRI